MSKFKLIHDRPVCIGCGACAVIAPDFWEMNDDGKSDIINGKHEGEIQLLDIDQKDFDINLEGAESCPVECIHIENKETGEKII
jgi:ferredoxin